ncbi:MAG: hypothetical protein ACI9HK_000039 [Pirellulaceae bacterium]|jgi:hypothetical protein
MRDFQSRLYLKSLTGLAKEWILIEKREPADMLGSQLRYLAITLCLTSMFCALGSTSIAQDRTLTPEQLEELLKEGELASGETKRPAKLIDLTKGERVSEMQKPDIWHFGPTGIVGYTVGGMKGDQIQVQSVLKGSPAEGKLQWGDVILGMNGKKFVAGEHLGMRIGKSIIEAEKEENGGVIKLIVWRDRNFIKRNGRRDVVDIDIEKLFREAADDKSLYEWKPEAARKQEVISADYKRFPIDGVASELVLRLDVLPPYSDTSPYDCPKAERIRENAWKVLEDRFAEGKVKANRTGTIMALALVASGKPEHREMIKQWVRSPAAKAWHPNIEDSIDIMKMRGYYSWFMSFDALDCAIYYDATGDEFVLPALREYAVKTAMGQAGGGSWGHTFAWPTFNGGKLHGMNPGYGALNAAGNRCFFLVALAQKLGIKHPEIDLAVKRGYRFFGSYVDKGGVPYGHHGAAATDDSNGKNTGVAFALKQIGDHHGAKYFAQMSTHASFTRRGGHGNDYFWHYSPWAATLCGPKGTIATHRNLRWRFTLCRRFDGAFVIQSPTGGMQNLRDPTATFALHYSAPLKQTLWTGKDADESYAWTDKEMDQLMTSALPQLNDPSLIQLAGKPYQERTTDELFQQLDMFKPKARGQYARELGKRYLAGEKEILPRFVELLESDEPRLRDSGCLGLAACGPDATLQYMSKVARLLHDPAEFIRMQAARTMTQASSSKETQLALLKATTAANGAYSMSPNSLRAFTQKMFSGESSLATSPFDAGFDKELIESAMQKVLELDPAGNRPFLRTRKGIWSKDTTARLAGPLIFVAEEEQIADQMFSARRTAGLEVLSALGYREYFDSTASYLRKRDSLPRHLRSRVHFKRGVVDAQAIKNNPAAFRDILVPLKNWIADEPLARVSKKVGEKTIHTNVTELISLIDATEKSPELPSLAAAAQRLFNSTLDQTDATGAKIKLCRAELEDLASKYYFRKIAAMTFLAETLGADAIDDLVPYIGHDYWRLRHHAYSLGVKLPGKAVTNSLLSHFGSTSTPAPQAAATLALLADRGDAETLAVARQALEHSEEIVRAAAVQALLKLGGENELKKVFAFMQTARGAMELEACEKALLSLRDNSQAAQQVRRVALWALPQWEPPVRHSLFWILAQLGGTESLSVLQIEAESSDDSELAVIVNSLSYSPDPRADELLLEIIKDNLGTPRAAIAAGGSLRRVVIGPDGIFTRSDKEVLDFAEPLLKMVRHESVVQYLGHVHSGRSAQVLQRVMRQGGVTDTAAESIIACTSHMEKAPAADKKLAAAALIDAIEFIEVTELRGGLEVRLKDPQIAGLYAKWKALSARAGKNLLKLDNPGKPPITEFNDLDLDF